MRKTLSKKGVKGGSLGDEGRAQRAKVVACDDLQRREYRPERSRLNNSPLFGNGQWNSGQQRVNVAPARFRTKANAYNA